MAWRARHYFAGLGASALFATGFALFGNRRNQAPTLCEAAVAVQPPSIETPATAAAGGARFKPHEIMKYGYPGAF